MKNASVPFSAAVVRPPGPKHPPIVGNLPEFRRAPLKFLLECARRYGDISYFRLGPQHAYLLTHPDFVREILVTRQNNFTKSRALQRARVLLGEGLLTSEGEHHRRQRRLVQPAFHRERLAGYASSMVELGARTCERWQEGVAFDVADQMMRLTLAIVGKTLFSADVESEATEVGEALTAILDMFNLLMMPFSELLEKLPLPQNRRFEKARERLDRIIYRMIRERRASGEDRGDLLSMLLLAQDEADGGMTDVQIRDEALTIVLAGHETTANALTWTWYLLAEHPEVETRLHEEVDRVLGGRLPGFDDLPRLVYTGMVLSESVRLYPPAWAIGRRAIHQFELGGYTIPARSIVIVSPYVTHRDPRYYSEPDRFDPERWRPGELEKRPKFAYFPFGGGARVCLGERFAWMEAVLLLATLAQKWRLKLMPGQRIEPKPLITLRTRHGVWMAPEGRT